MKHVKERNPFEIRCGALCKTLRRLLWITNSYHKELPRSKNCSINRREGTEGGGAKKKNQYFLTWPGRFCAKPFGIPGSLVDVAEETSPTAETTLSIPSMQMQFHWAILLLYGDGCRATTVRAVFRPSRTDIASFR